MFDIETRLCEERERLGKTQADFAALGRVEKRTQANYEAGTRVPDGNYLAAAAAAGVDVLYVLTGRRESKANTFSLLDPVRPDTTQTGAPLMGDGAVVAAGALLVPADASVSRPLRLLVDYDAGQTRREYQVIPRFRVAASAGPTDARVLAGDALAVDMAGVLAMDRSFMRAELGSDKPGFVTVRVAGDSMERTLIDGETIVIDSDVTEVCANGIYVVQVGKNLLVKRLVLGLDGSVLVKSDNPAYSAYDKEFSAEQAMAVRVVGRMVWPRFR